jgi:hypothetical protein
VEHKNELEQNSRAVLAKSRTIRHGHPKFRVRHWHLEPEPAAYDKAVK